MTGLSLQETLLLAILSSGLLSVPLVLDHPHVTETGLGRVAGACDGDVGAPTTPRARA